MAHNWLLPHLSTDKKLEHIESALSAPATSAASFSLGAKALNEHLVNEAGGLPNMLAVGAATEIASQWMYENLLLPSIDPEFIDHVDL